MTSCRFCRKEAIRTPDPYVPNVVRYQLRYFPKTVAKVQRFSEFTLATEENYPENLSVEEKIVLLHPQTKEGAIAQLVEHRTENPCVPGSIPGGTTKIRRVSLRIFCFLLFVRNKEFCKEEDTVNFLCYLCNKLFSQDGNPFSARTERAGP